ncbi:MAG: hypothetical protein PUF12_13460 [Thermoflexaceae bacterium]|nr:hypothetical protein [Thermoflexaceae bacterium]
MDYNITFPQESLNLLNAGGIIMISAIIIIGFILLMRYSAKLMPGFMGMLAYLIVVVVGVELVTYILSVVPGLNMVLFSTSTGYCITRAVIFALLIHLTRWIAIRFSDRNGELELGDALMAGLGTAIGQAIISGMDLIYISTLGTTINSYGMEQLLDGMTAEEIAGMMESVEQTISVPPMFYLFKGLNCTIDVVFQTAACLLIYAILKKGLPAFWHGILIVLTVILQVASLFGDYLVVENFMALTMVKFLVLVILIIAALRIDTEYLSNELKSFDKLKTSSGKMPKFNNVKNK